MKGNVAVEVSGEDLPSVIVLLSGESHKWVKNFPLIFLITC